MSNKRSPFRPQVEPLEDRRVLSTWVAFDLDTQGVVRFNEDRGWQLLGTADPSDLDIAENGDVVLDLDAMGLWMVSDRFGWQQLSTADPNSVSIAEDFVAASFPNNGVFRVSLERGWEKITDLNASDVVVNNDGDVLMDLDSQGLWWAHHRWGFQQLAAADPQFIAGADVDNVFAADFGGLGLWRIDDDDGFQLVVNQGQRVDLAIGDDGDIAAIFSNGSVWRFNEGDDDEPNLMISGGAEQVGMSEDGDMVVDLGAGGVVLNEDDDDPDDTEPFSTLNPSQIAVA